MNNSTIIRTTTLILLMIGMSFAPLASMQEVSATGARSYACTGTICLNEAMPNPSSTPDDAAWPGGEWAEIINTGSSPVDVSSWTLENRVGKILNFDSSSIVGYEAGNSSTWTIQPGDWMVLARNASTNFWLTNSQEDLTLKDASGIAVDQASWTNAVSGASYVENTANAAADWITSNGPTPGSSNSGATPPTIYPSDLVISEIMANPWPSSDNAVWPGGEWFEVMNNGSTNFDLSGWSAKDSAGNEIEFNETHLVGYDAANNTSWILGPGESAVIAINATANYGVLNNGQESLDLIWPNGSKAQTVQWSNTQPGVSISANQGGVWSYSIFPSPGETNVPFIPATINGTDMIRFTEVMPNSSTDGSAFPDGEWIEIMNIDINPLDLMGWKIMDSIGNITYLDSSSMVVNSTQTGTLIDAGGIRLLQLTSETRLWDDYNSLCLINQMGEIVDAIHWINDYGENVSLTNTSDLSQPWTPTPYPTPGLPTPGTTVAENTSVFINEVMSDPIGADVSIWPDGEWVELLNSGNETVNLTNWALVAGGNKVFELNVDRLVNMDNLSLESGAFALIAMNGSSSFYIRNSNGDSLSLRNELGEIVHSIVWTIQPTEGESLYAPPPQSTNGNWLQALWPTPGAANPVFGPYTGGTTIGMTEILPHCYDGSVTPDHDWIEIYNNGTGIINMSRWTFSSSDGETMVVRHDSIWNRSSVAANVTEIAPSEYLVVQAPNWFAKGYGDTIEMRDPGVHGYGNLIQTIEWTVTTDCRTLGPTDEGGDWEPTLWPTPGEENPNPDDYNFDTEVLFSRLMPFQTDFSERNNEFFELTNFGDAAANLNGWKITKTSSTGTAYDSEFTNMVIPAGGAIALTPDAEHLTSDGGFNAVNAIDVMTSAVYLPDAGGTLQLVSPDGTVIDAVAWGGALLPIEGWDGPSMSQPNASEEGLIHLRGDGCGNAPDTNTSADWEQKWSRLGGSHLCLVSSFSTTGSVTPLIGPDIGLGDLLAWIDSATTSIHVHMYHLHSNEIAFALRQAAGRGVNITLVLNEAEGWWGSDDRTQNMGHASDLAAAGVNVLILGESLDSSEPDSPYEYIHTKVAVKDDSSIWIGSGNWKHSSLPLNGYIGNRDWGVIVDSSSLAQMFLDRLAWDENPERLHIRHFIPSSDTPGGWVTPAPDGTVQAIEGTAISGSFSGKILTCPEDCVEGLRDSIEGANSEILLSLQYLDMDWYWGWGESPIIGALEDAAARGVSVRMIINGYYYDDEIREAVDIFNHQWNHTNGWDTAAIIMSSGDNITKLHNKGMIIDGQSVLISSINWGANSIMRNREMGLMIDSPAVADVYRQSWLEDWDRTDIENQARDEDNNLIWPEGTDTDGDGLPDWWEVSVGLNRTNALILDSTIGEEGFDTDGDGLINSQEFIYDGNPFTNDTDGDCISDDLELSWATSLTGVSEEVKIQFARKAMRSADADDDGVNDGTQYQCGSDFDEEVVFIPPDADDDGVADVDDQCPGTSSGVAVDDYGCEQTGPLDSDRDNVPDTDDDCPQTPLNTSVTVKGCSDEQLRQNAEDETNADSEESLSTPLLIIIALAAILLIGALGGMFMNQKNSLDAMDDIGGMADTGQELAGVGDDVWSIPTLDASTGPILDGSKEVPFVETTQNAVLSEQNQIDMTLFSGWTEDVVQAYLDQGWTVTQLKEWYDNNS